MGNPGSTVNYNFAGFSTKGIAQAPYDVLCKGYGDSALDVNGNQINMGTLRSGVSTVTTYDQFYAVLGFKSGATPQLPFSGDSGSACVDGTSKIIGVHSRGNNGGALHVPATTFSAWATAIMQAH